MDPARRSGGRGRFGRLEFTIEILALSVKGEDACLVAPDVAIVADGATPLGERAVDAVRFARCSVAAIARRSGSAASLRDAVRAAIARMGPPGDPSPTPSAAVVIARAGNGRLELGALGDCLRTVRTRDGRVVSMSADPVLAALDRAKGVIVEAGLAAGLSFRAARAALEPLLVAQRRLRNVPGGYWVLDGDPAVADHLRVGDVDLEAVEAVLLASDGFARLIEPFSAYDAASLLAAAERTGLAELGALLRRLETTDDSRVRAPRTSISDDATAILLVRGG